MILQYAKLLWAQNHEKALASALRISETHRNKDTIKGGHMKRLVTAILITWISIYGSSATLAASSYICIINHDYSLQDNGTIKTSVWSKSFEGNQFTVEKSDGAITGSTLTTILANETKIINAGSKENSFKAVAYFKNQVQIIEIQEFRSSKSKPFVALSMGGAGIISGLCQ